METRMLQDQYVFVKATAHDLIVSHGSKLVQRPEGGFVLQFSSLILCWNANEGQREASRSACPPRARNCG